MASLTEWREQVSKEADVLAIIGIALMILGVAMNSIVKDLTGDRVSGALVTFAFGLAGGSLFWTSVFGWV